MDPVELVRWRRVNGATVIDAAAALGVSVETYEGFEAGEAMPPELVAEVEGFLRLNDEDAVVPDVAPVLVEVEAGLSVGEALARKLGLRPYRTTNGGSGKADAIWDEKVPKAGWQKVPGCIRVVHADIPAPLPYHGPSWYGDAGVITASGRFYDAVTGREIRPIYSGPAPKRQFQSFLKEGKKK